MIPKRVLIIDDDQEILAVSELTLRAVGGWQVLTATSGDEGLVKAEAEQPDAILLDVMMPDRDGISTFHALQANPITQPIPVILMTAKAQAREQQKFATLGVAAIIVKPFKAMKLPAQIAEILGWDT
uniref:Response regulator n=1 Tax=Oscillatoriales cyanobacterium SpSt-402 TaxID=2282168 RepID=A0A832H5H9_9CYAN